MGRHHEFWKKTLKMKVFETEEEWAEWEKDCVKLPDVEAEVFRTASMGKSNIKKGFDEHGDRYDSEWEFVVATYHRLIKNSIVERNRTQWLPYYTDDGKQKKWYPDFYIDGRWVEVKGQVREADHIKMRAHPDVKWFFGEDVKIMERELNSQKPGWRENFIRTN